MGKPSDETKEATRAYARCGVGLFIYTLLCLLLGIAIACLFYRLSELEGKYDVDMGDMRAKISSLEKQLRDKEVTIDVDTLMNEAREKRNSDNSWSSEPKISLTVGQILELRGPPGRDGSNGFDGVDGKDGVNGRDGREGKDGSDGRDGRDGTSCDCDLGRMLTNQTGLMFGVSSAEIDLNIGVASAGSGSGSEGGSTYVRWGKTVCGNKSSLIYDGIAAGSYYTHSGGGSNYQCLPRDSEMNKWTATDTGGYIYGAEYESGSGIFPSAAQDQNVPCARCYAPRSAQMMIPGKRNCPDQSWTKEYGGYLMAGHRSHQRTTYECVDEAPDYVSGQLGNKNGALFYFQQASCSTLGICPPFVEGAEFTCVMCTK